MKTLLRQPGGPYESNIEMLYLIQRGPILGDE